MNLPAEAVAAIGALAGVISSIALAYWRDLRAQLAACQRQNDERDAAAALLLESYRQRDAEELQTLRAQVWQARREGGEAGRGGAEA